VRTGNEELARKLDEQAGEIDLLRAEKDVLSAKIEALTSIEKTISERELTK
jgi:Holliday junction resolvase-like predicted endonuclease